MLNICKLYAHFSNVAIDLVCTGYDHEVLNAKSF